jgi:MIP family channel proteins
MLGTYLLVLIGPGSVVVASLLSLPPVAALGLVAVVFGGTVAMIIFSLGQFSGAHVNPAITIGSTLSGTFDRRLLLPYISFQVAGGLLAGLSLRLALGPLGLVASLGSTKLAAGVAPVEGVFLEAVGTFVLTVSALAASSYVKTPIRRGLLVGGTLLVLILMMGPLTGASFNPARSLGPSLFSGYVENQVVYYLGPIIGATGAGLLFKQVGESFGRKSKKLSLVCLC